MLNEQEVIKRLESADADELANLVSRPTEEEERILRLYLGNSIYQRLHGLALRRELRQKTSMTPSKEHVVIVPGIFGCELSSFDQRGKQERIWLSARSIARGHLERLRLNLDGRAEANPEYSVQATGIMKRSYGELILTLAEKYNVHVFWYDWRKDFRIAAAQLQARVNTWFSPDDIVHFVAHAEGGLVVRSYIAHYAESWRQLRGKLLMIGTPNYGLYSAIFALTGQLEMIHWLDLLDSVHDDVDIRSIISSFPSLYQLLPAPPFDKDLESLYQTSSYSSRLAISAQHLESARVHHTLLRQSAVDPMRMIYIAGNNRPTIVGINAKNLSEYLLADPPNQGEYVGEIGLGGDGRVSHALGVLRTESGERVPTYFLDASYGALHTHPTLLRTLSDLLSGRLPDNEFSTEVVRKQSAPEVQNDDTAERDGEKTTWDSIIEKRESNKQAFKHLLRRLPLRAPVDGQDILYTTEDSAIEQTLSDLLSFANEGLNGHGSPKFKPFEPPKIEVGVICADIARLDELDAFSPDIDAIAVGHYTGGKPETAMHALDRAISAELANGKPSGELDHVLYQFTQRGTIQGELAQTFLLDDPRAQGTAVGRTIAIAGMGAPGRFGAPELSILVRELCWTVGRIGKKHLVAVLIGAGNGNLSVAESVAAWMRGLKFALTGVQHPLLERITFCEIDHAKAAKIEQAIGLEKSQYDKKKRMTIIQHPIVIAQHDDNETTESDVHTKENDVAPTRITVSLDGLTYRFGAITNDASIPERDIPLDPQLVQQANDELAAETDPKQQLFLGQFMERLLIPADLRNDLTGPAPIVMMLDATTARIHWELLGQTMMQPMDKDDNQFDGDDSFAHFWATSRGFTRQLRTVFAPPPEPPPPSNRIMRVLVVADPASDARLSGAEEEGVLVADLFESFNLVHANSKNRIEVVRLFGPREATRTAVLRHLMMNTYDVLHFAGHCVYDAEDPANSGWLFSNGQRLTAHEFNRIDRVPKFVFSNACESGVTPRRSERRTVALAPSFAEVFFARGVSNFVCTAWPVNDSAAREFALTVYANLLGVPHESTLNEAKTTLGRDNHEIPHPCQPEPMFRAMQRARLQIAQSPIYDIRTWGAYQHYGNPYFRFFDPSSMQSTFNVRQPTEDDLAAEVGEVVNDQKQKQSRPSPPPSAQPGQGKNATDKKKSKSKKKPIPQAESQINSIYFNGIDGRTGGYLTPPKEIQEVTTLLLQQKPLVKAQPQQGLTRGLPTTLIKEMQNLKKVGWGLVHHVDEDSAVLQALEPLFQRRLAQVGNEGLVRKLDYQDGEGLFEWLERHEVTVGAVNPDKVPFYLLVVGSPAKIPFSFGHQLDLEYAVGRLHFDTPEEYAQYAKSVVAYETNEKIRNTKEAVLFATHHEDDPVTGYSAPELVTPLAKNANGTGQNIFSKHGFTQRLLLGNDATQRALSNILLPTAADVHPPSFLFTATHGVGRHQDESTQRAEQGALICQDWFKDDPLEKQVYFSAEDLTDEARVHGLIGFFFACYSAGTPMYDRFFHRVHQAGRQIAEESFIAALPQRLLSHPNGGALACIGHVERTWVHAFKPFDERRLEPFINAVETILTGAPVGLALAHFNDKFAALSTYLSEQLENGMAPTATEEMIHKWLLRNDAEGFVLLGDPAVCLRIDELRDISTG